jgi:predicted amidohydrolase
MPRGDVERDRGHQRERCDDAPVVRADSIELTLVQPRTWTPDGDANFAEVARLLRSMPAADGAAAVVVLPELVGASMARGAYVEAVTGLAGRLQRWVVGGSHHWTVDGGTRNAGLVAAPSGEIVATFEKQNPYGSERAARVQEGDGPVVFDAMGVSIGAVICADFWHSECVQRLDPHPDVIAVASFSISRGRAPGAAKELWRHLAVTRAWEHGVHVGISDWSVDSTYGDLRATGLAASVTPTPNRPERFVTPLGNRRVRTVRVDIDRLRAFRADQHDSGLFPARAERLRTV